jgi:hypothetical protein
MYIVQTPERGLVLQPDTGWDGFADHEFVVVGGCDASYHSCPDTGRSVYIFAQSIYREEKQDAKLGNVV